MDQKEILEYVQTGLSVIDIHVFRDNAYETLANTYYSIQGRMILLPCPWCPLFLDLCCSMDMHYWGRDKGYTHYHRTEHTMIQLG